MFPCHSVRDGQNYTYTAGCIHREVTIKGEVFLGNNVVIEKGCILEDGVTIGHNSVIGEDCHIGERSHIETCVEILFGTKVGKDTMIRSFSRVGFKNNIGDRVAFKCAAITAAGTIIEDDTFIGPQAILMSDGDEGQTVLTVEKGSYVGAGARVRQSLVLGKNSIIGAGSVVLSNVDPETMVVGVPAIKKERR